MLSSTIPQPVATQGFSNEDIDIEGAIPLENRPKLSTETQRRNGYIQFNAADDATRIQEDIANGNYPCVICTEPLAHEDTVFYTMWQCNECHNVFHYNCIRDWASRNRVDTYGVISFKWKCVCCQHEKHSRPLSTCWCGKNSFAQQFVVGKPNMCENQCQRDGYCVHGLATTCQKECHPGPCSFQCVPKCDGLPTAPTKLDSEWKHAWLRVKRQETENGYSSLKQFVYVLLGLGVVIGAFVIFTSYYIAAVNEPYRYPGFTKFNGEGTFFLAFLKTFLKMLYVTFTCLFCAFACFMGYLAGRDILDAAMNSSPDRSVSAPISPGKLIIGLFTFVSWVSVSVLPIIIIIYWPNIAWKRQMRGTCNGFDTQIQMDGDHPAIFTMRTRSQEFIGSDFYIGSHLKPASLSNEPFQYYHRLSGGTLNGRLVAIDVDLGNAAWRLIHQNTTDLVNRFQAFHSIVTDGNQYPRVPYFAPMKETLINQGNFTIPNQDLKHMHFPSINMSISRMDRFNSHDAFEPFLRAFDTTDMSEADRDVLLDSMWSRRGDLERMRLRTSQFRGSERGDLIMCIKEDEERVDERYLVVWAVVQAMRSKGPAKIESF